MLRRYEYTHNVVTLSLIFRNSPAHKRLIGEDGQLPYRFEIQTIIKELQLDSYNSMLFVRLQKPSIIYMMIQNNK